MNKFKIISFFILTSFSSFSFAGAAERLPEIIEATTTSKYSSATGHNYTVGGVKADNGKLVATVAQRVVVDGSAATVTQKVTIPANDAFYTKTAGFAKGLLRGGAVGIASSLAMQQLLNGVGYVMGEGGQIQRPPNDDEKSASNFEWCYSETGSCTAQQIASTANVAYTISRYAEKKCAALRLTYPGYIDSCSATQTGVTYVYSGREPKLVNPSIIKNPLYDPSAPHPPYQSIPDSTAEDAFGNWLKNNSGSVTDPVTTYIYSPKTPTGAPATTPQNNPSFGQQEITDEMMDNYLANRNAELYANDVAANQAAIRDSAQTETESNPDGTTTTTKNNPDGSKTETKTETKTNPETGEVETTVTETVINPDGSRGESKQTETKTETKPNPQTSELPPVCEYFSVLCDWIGWTKENPEIETFDIPEKELQEKQIKKDLISVSAPSCPPDQHFDIQGLPFGISINKNYSMQPICNTLEPLKYVFLLITLCGCGFMILRI